MELTASDMTQYEEEGFLVIRDALDQAELIRFDKASRRHFNELPPGDLNYPDPGRYTLAKSAMADPDLAFVVEHPNIVGPASSLLKDDPILTAFVVYDRTPGGPGFSPLFRYAISMKREASCLWRRGRIGSNEYEPEKGELKKWLRQFILTMMRLSIHNSVVVTC